MEQPTPVDVVVRPFALSDLPQVRAFYEGLSPATRYRRFWTFSWSGPEWELDHLATDPGSAAVVAWADDRVVGVGRAQRLNPEDDVEVALVVADGWQGSGIGRRLGAALARRARTDGIRHIRATVRPGNVASLHLFRQGFPSATAMWDAGEIVLTADVA